MTVIAADVRPHELCDLPEANYSFYRLAEYGPECGLDGAGPPYAVAAIGEHEHALELHLTVLSWSPRVLRRLREDMQWLAAHARQRGKPRIIGATAAPNPLLSKFARKFGFTPCRNHVGADGRIYQLTYKEV